MPKGLPALRLASAEQPTGDYRLTFALSAESADVVRQQLRLLLAKWQDLGVHGGFTHPRAAAGVIPQIEVTEESYADDTYQCRLLAHPIDTRAFQLIRNMAGRLMLQGIEVRSVVVQERGAGGEHQRVPIPDDANETLLYPSISPHLEFSVEFEDSEWSKLRRCLVEMRSGVKPVHVTGVSSWIQPWVTSLEAGAYAMPVGLPTEVDSLGGFTSQFDELSIEISVMCFKASEMGWNTLLNSLGDYARRAAAPLSRATVD
jgi:hypothetical protein